MSAELKKAAALAALPEIKDGMTVGLGTGSTVAFLVEALGEKVRAGLTVKGIPTSKATEDAALAAGIELIIPDETTRIDVAIDGADEADPDGHLIKGGGGALLREKIIAQSARRFVVIADKSKDVAQLGKFPLPIEIDQFSFALSVKEIRETLDALGYDAPKLALRAAPQGGVALSDGGHYILDAHLERISDAEALDTALTLIPGVVTTGLFIGLTDKLIFASADGVEERDVR